MADDAVSIPRTAFVSLVQQLVSGSQRPFDPLPPGPWDPVIRKALAHIHLQPGVDVSLNPQPIPPGIAFAVALAQEVTDKARSLHELAEVLPADAQAHTVEAASRMLARFVDDCGNGRIPTWRWWWGRHWIIPRSPPPPHPQEVSERFTPVELIVLGVQFENSAAAVVNEQLQQNLVEAGAMLIEAGLAQM